MLGWLVFVVIVMGGMEIALRMIPEVIPLSLLKRFHHQPRLAIAQRRSLWNESQMVELPRDDGGPVLKLFRPGSSIAYDFHSKGERGTVTMDDQGFCNPARDDYDKAKIDVFSIGDSFTWCVVIQPQQTWTSELGRLSGRSVYNLGRPGIGPYAYLQILKTYAIPKHPDLVIMNIYEGNDLRDASRYQQHLTAARSGKQLFSTASDRNDSRTIDADQVLGGGVLRGSYAVNFVLAVSDKAWEGASKAVRRLSSEAVADKVDFHYQLVFPDGTVDFNVQNADESEVRSAHSLQSGDVDFTAFDAALKSFKALSVEHGFIPVVTYSPSAYTAYASFVRFRDQELQTLMPWFSQQQRSYLQDRVRALGMEFIDLTPALQQAASHLQGRELLYNPANVHFSAGGNRVVAKALDERLFGD